jgi:capsid protein
MQEVARNEDIFSKAVRYMAANIPQPVIYDAHGRPFRKSAGYTYRRTAAQKTGSQKNWIPRRLLSNIEEASEREVIVERSVDLTNNDPHGAGVVDTFATTIVGSGLVPHPSLGPDTLALEKDEIRLIQAQQRGIYQTWSPFADAARRMNFGAVQFLIQRNLMQYGEYLVLLPMMKDPLRPYSLACQVINPLRLRTPSDKSTDRSIIDGVEIDIYGAPVAYWIQKSEIETGKSY